MDLNYGSLVRCPQIYPLCLPTAGAHEKPDSAKTPCCKRLYLPIRKAKALLRPLVSSYSWINGLLKPEIKAIGQKIIFFPAFCTMGRDRNKRGRFICDETDLCFSTETKLTVSNNSLNETLLIYYW